MPYCVIRNFARKSYGLGEMPLCRSESLLLTPRGFRNQLGPVRLCFLPRGGRWTGVCPSTDFSGGGGLLGSDTALGVHKPALSVALRRCFQERGRSGGSDQARPLVEQTASGGTRLPELLDSAHPGAGIERHRSRCSNAGGDLLMVRDHLPVGGTTWPEQKTQHGPGTGPGFRAGGGGRFSFIQG